MLLALILVHKSHSTPPEILFKPQPGKVSVDSENHMMNPLEISGYFKAGVLDGLTIWH